VTYYVSEAQLVCVLRSKKDIRDESLYEDIYTDDFKSFFIYRRASATNDLIIREYLKKIDNQGVFKCSKFLYKTSLNFKLTDLSEDPQTQEVKND
jgi:hypothetical protein